MDEAQVWEIDGFAVFDEKDFHVQLMASPAFPFRQHYGKNLDALWDVLTRMLEEPSRLVWRNASLSRERLGPRFDMVVKVLRDAEAESANYEARFELVLEG